MVAKLFKQGARGPEGLGQLRCGVAFVGESVDDRGLRGVEYAREVSLAEKEAHFDVLEGLVTLNEDQYLPDELYAVLERESEIFLEATTLGLVEVFLLLRAAVEADVEKLHILYIEPERYFIPQRSDPVLHRRDFDLSEEVQDFSGVPGAAIMLVGDAPTKTVFFVGYEGQRLEQALESTNVKPSRSSVVFGVPAFQAGWEMDSFANNVEILNERRIGEVLYAAAADPGAAFSVLEAVRKALDQGERLLIAPIGTKPHGIGAALFAAQHQDVGLLYDHPVRRQGRSSDTGVWHLYTLGS